MLWRIHIIWWVTRGGSDQLTRSYAYRYYRQRSWSILIFPTLISLITEVAGLVVIILAPRRWSAYMSSPTTSWTYLGFASAAFGDCLMTGLIAGRIYYAGRGRSSKHPYRRLILILVESQALHTVVMIIYPILLFLKVDFPPYKRHFTN